MNITMNIIRRIFNKIIRNITKSDLEKLISRGLIIGNNFNMMPGCIIDSDHCWHISIGNNVTLAPRVHILAHDTSTKAYLNYTKVSNVKIGNSVFIGASSIVMPGVVIGNNVIVGAGSLVTKSIPSNTVYAGNPARFICNIDDYLKKQKAKMNNVNVFSEEFTLRKNVSLEKKNTMKLIVEENTIGFVE